MADEFAELGGIEQLEAEFHRSKDERRRPNEKTYVEEALKGIRQRSENAEDHSPFRDGQTLLIGDIEETLDNLPIEFHNTGEITTLRSIEHALGMLDSNNGIEVDPATMTALTAYFRSQRDRWDNPLDIESKEEAKTNKEIYSQILDAIYKELPIPEAVIGEAPVAYKFDNIDAITQPLQKLTHKEGVRRAEQQELNLDNVLETYEAVNKDVKKSVEGNNQIKLVNEARGFSKRHLGENGYNVVVVILKDDGTVDEMSPFKEGKKYPPVTADGKKQFIIDVDGPYSQTADAYEKLKTLAENAVQGIKKLKDGDKVELTTEELDGIFNFSEYLRDNTETGSMDQNAYNKVITTFRDFVMEKLIEAGAIDSPEAFDENFENIEA